LLWWHQNRRNISLTLSLKWYWNLLAKHKDYCLFILKNVYFLVIIVYDSHGNWLLICISITFVHNKFNFENSWNFMFQYSYANS
jgi:hypothetical protein